MKFELILKIDERPVVSVTQEATDKTLTNVMMRPRPVRLANLLLLKLWREFELHAIDALRARISEAQNEGER